jgi:hypothetical protein
LKIKSGAMVNQLTLRCIVDSCLNRTLENAPHVIQTGLSSYSV